MKRRIARLKARRAHIRQVVRNNIQFILVLRRAGSSCKKCAYHKYFSSLPVCLFAFFMPAVAN
jgi:hypothetical protein